MANWCSSAVYKANCTLPTKGDIQKKTSCDTTWINMLPSSVLSTVLSLPSQKAHRAGKMCRDGSHECWKFGMASIQGTTKYKAQDKLLGLKHLLNHAWNWKSE